MNERTGFASCATAFESYRCAFVCNELLTKKLSLSHLNEISKSYEKIKPVSESC